MNQPIHISTKGDEMTTTLGEFITANAFSPEDVKSITDGLDADGRFEVGGGAAPLFTITEVLPKVGAVYRLITPVERYQYFTASEGLVGVVAVSSRERVALRMTEILEGAEEFGNCIEWLPDNNPGDLAEFWSEVEEVTDLAPVLEAMAKAARPTEDDDWGSEPQIAAQNAFFDKVQTVIPANEFRALERYCHKATTDEMIDEGLRVVRMLDGRGDR